MNDSGLTAFFIIFPLVNLALIVFAVPLARGFMRLQKWQKANPTPGWAPRWVREEGKSFLKDLPPVDEKVVRLTLRISGAINLAGTTALGVALWLWGG